MQVIFFACLIIQKPPGSDSNVLHKYKFEGTNTKRNFSPDTKAPPPRDPLFSHKDPHNWLIIVSVGSQKELDTFPVSVLAVCSSGEAAQRCLRCVWELQTYRVSSRLFKTAEYGSIDSLCGRRMNAWSDPITAVLPVFVGTFSIEADRKTINALRKICVSNPAV